MLMYTNTFRIIVSLSATKVYVICASYFVKWNQFICWVLWILSWDL